MTIFGMRYRPAPYRPVVGWRRAWPLAQLEFRSLFRSIWGVVLFVFCALPSIFQLFVLLAFVGALGFGQGRMMRRAAHGAPQFDQFNPESVQFYLRNVVYEDGVFVFVLLTALTTSRVIAKDRRTNALEFYWTRGISPRAYFLAKLVGSVLLVGALTVALPTTLWLIGALLADDWTFLGNTVHFVPQLIAALAAFTCVLVLPCVLLSAVAATANVATILWCLLVIGGMAVAEVVGQIVDRDVSSWLSLWGAANTVATSIVGVAERGQSLGGALAFFGGLTVVLAVVARRRLRVQGAVA